MASTGGGSPQQGRPRFASSSTCERKPSGWLRWRTSAQESSFGRRSGRDRTCAHGGECVRRRAEYDHWTMTSLDLRIERASEDDVSLILTMIKALADYEHLALAV